MKAKVEEKEGGRVKLRKKEKRKKKRTLKVKR